MSQAPLTPADLDLRDFDWMPLDVARLRDSDLSVLASGDAFRAAVLLWCAAWHQVPAASLPLEDKLLAHLAGYGRDLDGWASVRADALRGFVECSDGRLYHPVVAQKAMEADEQRNKKRKRTEAATAARRNGQRNDDRNDNSDKERDVDRNDCRNEHHQTVPDTDHTLSPFGGEERAPAKVVLQGLGSQIDPTFHPASEAIDRCREQGATEADIDSEIRKFIAHHQVKQTFSPNWNASWAKWWENWKPHKTRQRAATKSISDRSDPVDWDAICDSYRRFGIWSKHAPGNAPGSSSCLCPPEILARHGIDNSQSARGN